MDGRSEARSPGIDQNATTRKTILARKALLQLARRLLYLEQRIVAERIPLMLRWALIFLVVALVAAVLGFGGIAGTAAGIAKILFFVFIVIAAIAFIMNMVNGKRV